MKTSLLFLKGSSLTLSIAMAGTNKELLEKLKSARAVFVFEFTDNCRRQGIRVVEARVLAHGRATPFQPVLALLRDIFGVQATESAEVSRRRVIDRFAALSGSDSLLLVLLDFLGLADPSKPTVETSPKTRKMQLLDPCSGPSRAQLRPTPRQSFFVEDLHWIDAASEEFVEAFADAVVGTTVLLVVNFRPGFTAPLMQRSHYRQVNMLPLTIGRRTTSTAGLLWK